MPMNCKFCNAEFEQEQTVCPVCGKDQSEEEPAAEVVVEDTEMCVAQTEETTAEAASEETQKLEDKSQWEKWEPAKKEANKGKKNIVATVMSIVAAVASLAILATLLLYVCGFDFKSLLPKDNDIFYKECYEVEDGDAADKGDVVIATMGDKKLTNAHLQIHYRMQVLDFLNYYGSYVEQLGFTMDDPLCEQTCYFDDTMSWEQYFISKALENWQSYQAMACLAEENGFELEGEWLESLEKLPEDLQAQAEQSGYTSVDELLKNVIGPACTEKLYMEYVRLAYTCNAYYSYLCETTVPTEAEVSAYYDENAEAFSAEGITREMGNIADVRHILVCPKHEAEEGGESSLETAFTEEEWAACLAEAEKILEEWKSGEATEATFAELATKYTEDTGSASVGGLYEGIAPGDNYVENFLNWTVDASRQPGDTDIVKTEYGYHIMYYVSGEPYWYTVVRDQMISESVQEKGEAAKEKWPVEITYRKIAMSELKFS